MRDTIGTKIVEEKADKARLMIYFATFNMFNLYPWKRNHR